jgi:hypothetical protein
MVDEAGGRAFAFGKSGGPRRDRGSFRAFRIHMALPFLVDARPRIYREHDTFDRIDPSP